MITVARGVLLESKAALEALGKVYVPIGKENYWFVKTLSKLQQAMKANSKISGKESNRLVEEFGTAQPNGRKGILQTDVEAMESYSEGMDAHMAIPVQIDIKQLTLTQLKEAQVSLVANDQVALMWLFSEE
jgi:hypothetical protein